MEPSLKATLSWIIKYALHNSVKIIEISPFLLIYLWRIFLRDFDALNLHPFTRNNTL